MGKGEAGAGKVQKFVYVMARRVLEWLFGACCKRKREILFL
jgi:hypothetical protein